MGMWRILRHYYRVNSTVRMEIIDETSQTDPTQGKRKH